MIWGPSSSSNWVRVRAIIGQLWPIFKFLVHNSRPVNGVNQIKYDPGQQKLTNIPKTMLTDKYSFLGCLHVLNQIFDDQTTIRQNGEIRVNSRSLHSFVQKSGNNQKWKHFRSDTLVPIGTSYKPSEYRSNNWLKPLDKHSEISRSWGLQTVGIKCESINALPCWDEKCVTTDIFRICKVLFTSLVKVQV